LTESAQEIKNDAIYNSLLKAASEMEKANESLSHLLHRLKKIPS
jgi:hypothetical protein